MRCRRRAHRRRIRALHGARVEAFAATDIQDRGARIQISADGVEHGVADVVVIAGLEDARTVLERRLVVERRLFRGGREIDVALFRDIEGVTVRAAQARAIQVQRLMADRANEVAFAVTEARDFRRIHAAILAGRACMQWQGRILAASVVDVMHMAVVFALAGGAVAHIRVVGA